MNAILKNIYFRSLAKQENCRKFSVFTFCYLVNLVFNKQKCGLIAEPSSTVVDLKAYRYVHIHFSNETFFCQILRLILLHLYIENIL